MEKQYLTKAAHLISNQHNSLRNLHQAQYLVEKVINSQILNYKIIKNAKYLKIIIDKMIRNMLFQIIQQNTSSYLFML